VAESFYGQGAVVVAGLHSAATVSSGTDLNQPSTAMRWTDGSKTRTMTCL